MKAPPRLSDPKSGASGLLRLLVHSGQTDLPDPARMRTLAARLGPLAGGGIAGATGGGDGAVASGAAKGVGATAALKVGVAVTLAVAVGGGAIVGLRQTPRPTGEVPVSGASAPLARPPASAPLAPAPSPESASEPVFPAHPAPVVASTPTPARLPTANAVTAASAAPPVSAESEISLLQAAQAALRDNPTSALALADRHASHFATGALAQEREVIAIEALLALSRREEANERGARFARDFPNSAHRPRIEALLSGSDHNR